MENKNVRSLPGLSEECSSYWSEEQFNLVNRVKNDVGLDKVLQALECFSGLRVTVVGEPIIDSYVYCNPQGISSKSATVSANYQSEENHPGGAWAVAAHLDSLGCNVTIIAPTGDEGYIKEIEKSLVAESDITLLSVVVPTLKTHRKVRYVSPLRNQSIFELTYLDHHSWSKADLIGFRENLLSSSIESDVVFVMDFGHGLWEGGRLDLLDGINTYKAFNVQANSGNLGFNVFHRHQNFDYLSIDERELRLALRNRIGTLDEVIAEARSMYLRKSFSVTLGSRGSCFLSQDSKCYSAPVFHKDPVDTTGAGDAFFAITSLLDYTRASPELIPFIGNIFAGLKTRIQGNRSPVSKSDLINHITSILS